MPLAKQYNRRTIYPEGVYVTGAPIRATHKREQAPMIMTKNSNIMHKTMIHIKACNLVSSEAERRRDPDYVKDKRTRFGRDLYREDLQYLNRFSDYGLGSKYHLAEIRDMMAQRYTEVHGQRPKIEPQAVRRKDGTSCLREGWAPIREGVLIISPNTTMHDLANLAVQIYARFGLKALSIDIHRDEGHWDDQGEWRTNQHAHMVFDAFDWNTAKTRKLSRKDMADLQTMTAIVLGMERGTPSSKRHLDVLEYRHRAMREQTTRLRKRVEEEDERLKRLETKIKGLTSMISNLQRDKAKIEDELDKLRDEIAHGQKRISYDNERRNELRKELKEIENSISDKTSKLESAEVRLEELKKSISSNETDLLIQKYQIKSGEVTIKRAEMAREALLTLNEEINKAEAEFVNKGTLVASYEALRRIEQDMPDIMAYVNAKSWDYEGTLPDKIEPGFAKMVMPLAGALMMLPMGGIIEAVSGGGGSSSDLRWDGKNPGEDDDAYRTRCIDMAISHTSSKGPVAVKRIQRRR